MFRKFYTVVFAFFLVSIALGSQAVFAQSTGQKGTRKQALAQGKGAQLRARIFGIKDEGSLDAALAKLVGEGRLTEEQATKIRAQWKNRQGRSRQTPVLNRLRGIKDEGKLNDALLRLTTSGRITQDQAARIRQQWQRQHDRAGTKQARGKARPAAKAKKSDPTAAILGRIRGAKTEAQVDKVLGKMISKGRITPDQAARIKDQWKKRH
jgi:hypothetical protein